MAGPKPVSTGHDQQYSKWHWRPIWDFQHHHETQTQGEQFQGLDYTPKHRDQPWLYIVSECFILRPWALVLTSQPQSDVSHILYSLGYCSCKVGARATLRLPPTQGPPSDPNERHFSLDSHGICTPTSLTFKNPLVAASQYCMVYCCYAFCRKAQPCRIVSIQYSCY